MKATSKTLFLILFKEYFDAIDEGTKKTEYRDDSIYWRKRLMNPDGSFKNFDYVHFRNGYNLKNRAMVVKFNGIGILGGNFEIYLGEIIERKNFNS